METLCGTHIFGMSASKFRRGSHYNPQFQAPHPTTKEQEIKEPIAVAEQPAMVDESGLTPQPERMGEKVWKFYEIFGLLQESEMSI